MGFTGVHLIVLLVIAVVVVVVVVGAVYLLIRKSVAAGVRDGHRATGEDQRRR